MWKIPKLISCVRDSGCIGLVRHQHACLFALRQVQPGVEHGWQRAVLGRFGWQHCQRFCQQVIQRWKKLDYESLELEKVVVRGMCDEGSFRVYGNINSELMGHHRYFVKMF